MKKILLLLVLLFCYASVSFSQPNTAVQLVDKGVALYDAGNYTAALEKYKEALLIDEHYSRAYYETAYTYYAMQEHKQAIKYADKVIKEGGKYLVEAYTLKANILDMTGKPEEAVAVYKEAMDQLSGGDYMLCYNYALTLFEIKEFDEAERIVIKGMRQNPMHASSHLLFGNIMLVEEKRIQGMLADEFFLFREPDSKRSKTIVASIDEQLKKGVTKKENNTININFNPGKKSDPFSSIELMVGLREAYFMGKDSLTEQEKFYEITKTIIELLDIKKSEKGFLWTFYVPFYKELLHSDNLEAFCYYIHKSKDDDQVKKWLQNNPAKIDKLINWFAEYMKKNGMN